MAKELTTKDLELLMEYKAAIKEWSGREPAKLTAEEWDEAWVTIQATGEIPEKYKRRIGVQDTTIHSDIEGGRRVRYPEGKTVPGYYDIVWEAWGAEGAAITARYQGVIAKALRVALEREKGEEPQSVDAIIDGILLNPPQASSMLLQKYLPMLNEAASNDLMGISRQGLEIDNFTHRALFTKDGHVITVKNFDELMKLVGVGGKKLWDTSVLYLTAQNFYKGERVSPSITIDLMDYWRAQGYEVDARPTTTEEEAQAERERIVNLKKRLKREINDNMEALRAMSWDSRGTGQRRGDRRNYDYISGFTLRGDKLKVNFDIDIATALVHGYVMQYPTALLLHDNRDPNGYVIGRKLAYHHSMDSNAAVGTQNTLSVKSLLEEAPEIVSYEELVAKGRRDWKRLIKEKLEQALNKNISPAPLITRWEYRDPATGQTYTPETASSLSWDAYSKLMVDFIMAEEPAQDQRRAARAEEKAARQAETPKKKKKRGRPRKEKKEG